MSKTSNYLFPRLSGNKLSPIKSTSQPIKVAEQPYKPSPNLYLDGSKAIIKDSYPNPYTKGVDRINSIDIKRPWWGELMMGVLEMMFY